MKKSPKFQTERICQKCNLPFIPTGARQIYCIECKKSVIKETKQKHYKKNNPTAYLPKETKVCSICGGKFACNFNNIPYCNKHYLKMKFYGTTETVRKTKNTYEVINNHVEIKTTKNEIFLIDLEDLEKVLKYTWCTNKAGYLVANINRKVIRLHRYILNVDIDKVIDHINGNPLDNRKSNLRICLKSENIKNMKIKKNNTSGYIGIRLTPSNKYNVRITVNNKEIHVGNFNTLEEAIKSRKEAEIKYFGEFAPSLSVLKDN